jgi:hypothetical protein
MFIAANIVGCRLRHKDARCTHRQFNKLVSVTILQSFAFFFFFLRIFMYLGGGGANRSLCPGCPIGKTRPCLHVTVNNTKPFNADMGALVWVPFAFIPM